MPDRLRVEVFLDPRSIKAMSGSPVRLSAQARISPLMAGKDWSPGPVATEDSLPDLRS